MQLADALTHTYDQIRGLVHGVLDGIEPAALSWRPDPQSNTIAWLLWHLTRVQDDHVAAIAGREQVWSTEGWAPRFGLPAGAMDTGFGHTADEVAAVDPADPRVLADYHDRVAEATMEHLEGADPDDFERVIDVSYDPPVTAGVRLLSVTIDSLQHVGQAAYVRGLWERRAMARLVDLGLEELPDELRSRILAATANAAHRRIELIPDRDVATYAVEAVSGDRLTLMELALRPDGSVAESTQSVTADEVVEIHHDEERVELLVGRPGSTRPLLVSPAAIAALLPGRG